MGSERRYIATMELHTLPFVVVDVETTGGQPFGSDRVTDVAAVHVDGDRVQVASGSVLVRSVPADHTVKTKIVTTVVVPSRR